MRCRIPLLLTIALLLPSPATADWLLSPFVGLRFGVDTTLFFAFEGTDKNKFLWGVSSGFLSDDVLGVEVDFSYVPGFFESDDAVITASSRVIALSGNLIFTVPLSATSYGLRPYVTGGFGLLHARSVGVGNIGDVLDIDSNFLAVNIGGGAIGPVSPRSSVRFDLRHVRSMTTDEDAVVNAPGTQLSFWRATVGLTIRFRP